MVVTVALKKHRTDQRNGKELLMEHKMMKTTWKTTESVKKEIASHEKEAWSVAAMGEVFGANLLLLVRDGKRYEHEVTSVMFKTSERIAELLDEKAEHGWQACAIGECFGGVLLITKRERE
jgi:hypothetical protein